MPKFAAYVVAQLLSLALALGVTYALNRTPGLAPAPDVRGAVTWPVIFAWALILFFVTPALYRFISRGFAAKTDDSRLPGKRERPQAPRDEPKLRLRSKQPKGR